MVGKHPARVIGVVARDQLEVRNHGAEVVEDAVGEPLARELDCLDQRHHGHEEPGLLPDFTDDGLLRCLSRLDLSARERPRAYRGGPRPTHEQHGAIRPEEDRTHGERRHPWYLAPMDLAALALDDAWLNVLDDVAETSHLALAPARLAAAVRAVSDAYNSADFARARGSRALAARLSFFFPRDVPKVGAAARELLACGVLPRDWLRVLDFGAGLGASTWGLARALASTGARIKLDATLVDDDAQALGVARAIATRRAREEDVDVAITTGPRPEGAYDVVLVGQSLGEITQEDNGQVALLEGLLQRSLAPSGALIVVEPALRERTRRLHRVRDRLLELGYTVFAPCLHEAPCPALADDDAWCHEDVRVDLPPRVAAVARAAGLRWQGLTFSYLVLRRDGEMLGKHAGAGAQRVVSLPIVTKGKRELYLCADGVRRKVARLDRHGQKNDAWTRAERGDVLAFDPPLAVEASRVSAETVVRRT